MVYHDSDGNEVTLRQLIKLEPEWAYSKIKASEDQSRQITELQQQVEVLTNANHELKASNNRLRRRLAYVGILFSAEASYESDEGIIEWSEASLNEINKTQEILEESPQTSLAEHDSSTIRGFINHLIGFFYEGIVGQNHLTLAQLHGLGQNYIKDTLGVYAPHITDDWGNKTASRCGFDAKTN